MPNLSTLRKEWNAAQKQLRPLLSEPDRHKEAIQLFLGQHAVLHSARLSTGAAWSFEDLLLDDLPEEDFRRLLPKEEHTIAWHVWHIARIEDITMHILVAGEDQILNAKGWQEKLKVRAKDTGNAMSLEEIQTLSNSIDFAALRDYRLAVGRETRRIVPQIPEGHLTDMVDPERLQKCLDVGAVVPEAIGLIDYWGKRTLGGLLGMPPSRHLMVHLNQASILKDKLRK